MKVTRTDEVFQDTLTGVYYTEQRRVNAVAVLGASEKAMTFGTLMAPYFGHPSLPYDGEMCRDEQIARFGFMPDAIGQEVLVPDDVLAQRFKRIDVLSQEVDLDSLVAHYEEERCDFSNRPALIRSTLRDLARNPVGLRAAELYTLLKDYMRNTPK